MRLRHSSSPLGSTGSSNESWPLLSKDEDAEMYSPHRHKINEVDDINRTDSEEQEDISEEDDRQEEWNQVIFKSQIIRQIEFGSLKTKFRFFIDFLLIFKWKNSSNFLEVCFL